MNREDVVAALKPIMRDLEDLGVRDLRVFGSVARGDADQDSDVDFLVDLEDADYSRYCRVLERLESAIGPRVDLVMFDALKPDRRDRIVSEAVRVA